MTASSHSHRFDLFGETTQFISIGTDIGHEFLHVQGKMVLTVKIEYLQKGLNQ